MLQSTIANRPDLKPDLKILGQAPAAMRSLKQAGSLASEVGETAAIEPSDPMADLKPAEDDPAARPRTTRRQLKRTLVVIGRPEPEFVSSPREPADGEPLTLAERARMQLRSQRRSAPSSVSVPRSMRISKSATAGPVARATQRLPLKRPLKLVKAIDTAPSLTEPAPAPEPPVAAVPFAELPTPVPSPEPTARPDKSPSTSLFERLPFGLGRLFAKT